MATAPDHGAIPEGDGAAHPLGFTRPTSPGAIGAGRPWMDTAGEADGHFTPKIRNTANDGFLAANASFLGGGAAASYAKLASPAFTGTPTAPTAAAGTDTTQLATTAFVKAAIASPSGQSFGISVPMSGGASAIPAGVYAYLEIPVACTITAARLVTPTAASLVLDLWKDSYANFPPTIADTITASAKPTLASTTKHANTLTGWTLACAAGDWLAINVDSGDAVTATLALRFVRT